MRQRNPNSLRRMPILRPEKLNFPFFSVEIVAHDLAEFPSQEAGESVEYVGISKNMYSGFIFCVHKLVKYPHLFSA